MPGTMAKYLAAAGFGAVCAAALDQRLVLRRYTLHSSKLPGGSCLRIVLLSDLHGAFHVPGQRRLIQAVAGEAPDLILLPGDIIDEYSTHRPARLLLRGIREVAPVYYASGNHEYWCRHPQDVFRELARNGAVILADRYEVRTVRGIPVVLAGVEDPAKSVYDQPSYRQVPAMERAFQTIGRVPGYRILLAHRPDRVKLYRRYPFDLVVSGHAHGGQVRIPGLVNGLYAPNQGWFPPRAGGLYRCGPMTHVVGRGLDRRAAPPRIFNPPEVVSVTVRRRA